jgi:2-polyprenyl-3-methyl-5-hydroxy-6-metoxy-1,4-benzoquinol methylase
MKRIHTTELQSFVNQVDNEYGGDLNHPELLKIYPLVLDYDTHVNEDLDAFSDEYYYQQINLYEEISDRKLSQESGELHPVDIERLSIAPNPLGVNNSSVIAEHMIRISEMLNICNLGISPKVLDMGAGHGLSSELYAYAGAEVHAIDIDPQLGRLASDRAISRRLNIKRTTLNFDDISGFNEFDFDAAFFYQSLHHCLKPWVLISKLKEKLKANAVIGFAGEPLHSPHWRAWGLRLDHESLYVAKKFGWFESGWSAEFITECFSRNNYHLHFYNGKHLGHEIGVASLSNQVLDDVFVMAQRSGIQRVGDGGERIAVTPAYSTAVGMIVDSPFNKKFFRTQNHRNRGYLCYGPYAALKKGRYKFRIYFEKLFTNKIENIIVDVVHTGGIDIVYSETLCLDLNLFSHSCGATIERDFELLADVKDLEVRVFIEQNIQLICSSPEILFA